MEALNIFNPDGFPVPVEESQLTLAMELVQQEEQCRFEFVELVYLNEEEIVEVNQQYLERDYVTDVITFRYDEDPDNDYIEGTVFCCAPRIIEQAEEFSESQVSEFLRIFLHGLLHLNGYEDDTVAEKEKMRTRENFYLSKLLQQ